MSHIHQGPLATYNSLTDKHLSGYYGNSRIRRHLIRSGLINKRGQLITENQYRINMARKEHKKHVKDLLAQAIVHKTLDMERYRQVEIRKKLEEIAKIEVVRRIRGMRGRKGDEEVLPYLSPNSSRPMSERPREKISLRYRPQSAPGLERNGHVKPHDDTVLVDEDGRPVTPPPLSEREVERKIRKDQIDSRHLYALDSTSLQKYAHVLSRHERGGAVSPYLIVPIPTPPQSSRTHSARRRTKMVASPHPPKEKKIKPVKHTIIEAPKDNTGTIEGSLMLHRHEPAMMHQGEVQSFCEITMKYHGPNLTLPRDQNDPTQDVSIDQQHCGGNTLQVFRKRLEPGNIFTFLSRRHRGYPFSLTIYIDGRTDCRVSTCCEYKHAKGIKLGGKMGHFTLVDVSGDTPCYKCQLSLQAPPKKMKSVRKAEPIEQEVTVSGKQRTPVVVSKEDVSSKSEEEYDSDFEKEEEEETKYEEDSFDSDDEKEEKKDVKAYSTEDDDKPLENVEVLEEESSDEDEHRKIEGYSDDDEGFPESKIKVAVDVYPNATDTTQTTSNRRRPSLSSSSSSSSSSDESTPRKSIPAQKVIPVEADVREIKPKPKEQTIPIVEVANVEKTYKWDETPRTDRSTTTTTSTTSSSLTTDSETDEQEKRAVGTLPPVSESPERRKPQPSISSSSSSSSSSESETEVEDEEKKIEEEAPEDIQKKTVDSLTAFPEEKKDKGYASTATTTSTTTTISSESSSESETEKEEEKKEENIVRRSPPKSSSSSSSSESETEVETEREEKLSSEKSRILPVGNASTSTSGNTTTSNTETETTTETEDENQKVEPSKPRLSPTPEERKKSDSESSSSESETETTETETTETEDDKKKRFETAKPRLSPTPEEKKKYTSTSSSDSETETTTETETEDEKKRKLQLAKPRLSPTPEEKKKSHGSSSSESESETETVTETDTDRKKKGPAPVTGQEPPKPVATEVSKGKKSSSSGSEDSSEDSSSSDSDSDTETASERDVKKKPVSGRDPDGISSGKSQLVTGSIMPLLLKQGANVNLNSIRLSSDQVAELANFISEEDELRSVVVHNAGLSDDSFQRIALGLKVSACKPELLNFTKNNLGEASMPALIEILHTKPSVKTVLLHGNPLGDDGSKKLADGMIVDTSTRDRPTLSRTLTEQEMWIEPSGYITPSEERAKQASKRKGPEIKLKTLDLGKTGMTDLGIEAIANMLEKDGGVEELNLNQNTAISLAGWSRLGRALETNSTLKKLSLDNNPVGDDGIQKIADGLRQNMTLTSLELGHIGMRDRGGKALLSLLTENSTICTLTINPGNTVSESIQNGIKNYLALNTGRN